MKLYKLILLSFYYLFTINMTAQYLLEVDGHAKIDGRIELNTTLQNMFIGQNAGILNSNGVANVMLGVNSGASNSNGHSNVFIGETAGESNFGGFHNVFIGRHAGRLNVSGVSNVFIGRSAGNNFNPSSGIGSNVIVGTDAGVLGTSFTESTMIGFFSGNNSEGIQNAYFGAYSGNLNFGSSNTFIGYKSGEDSGSGRVNTFIGYRAGTANMGGIGNTCLGSEAGSDTAGSSAGSDNLYVGRRAGANTEGGLRNIYIGYLSGWQSVSGTNNIYIGSMAGQGTEGEECILLGNGTSLLAPDLSNSTAIGANASVSVSNKIRLGNSSITVIEGQVPFSPASDRRLKKNIESTSIGLDLINKLRPVTYNWKEGHEEILYTGLIAQEVEEAAKSLGYDFSAIVQPSSEEGHYSLRYSDMVVPLINAVQTLSEQNDELVKEIKALKEILITELDDH